MQTYIRLSQKHVNDIIRQVKTIDGVPYIPAAVSKGAMHVRHFCSIAPGRIIQCISHIGRNSNGSLMSGDKEILSIWNIHRLSEDGTPDLGKLNLKLDRPNDVIRKHNAWYIGSAMP